MSILPSSIVVLVLFKAIKVELALEARKRLVLEIFLEAGFRKGGDVGYEEAGSILTPPYDLVGFVLDHGIESVTKHLRGPALGTHNMPPQRVRPMKINQVSNTVLAGVARLSIPIIIGH